MERETSMVAIFRADGSRHLGMGHIMRCLALARGLESAGIKSVFIARDYDQSIKKSTKRYGYDLSVMPADYGFENDTRFTIELAGRYKAGIIITDLCNTDSLKELEKYIKYLQELKDSGRFLITIDDLNVMPFPSDIVINPNYGAESNNYYDSGTTKYLLGPDYFIFRQEFIKASGLNREIWKDIRNILATVGGSDLSGFSDKVAGALITLKAASDLNLRMIMGSYTPVSRKQEIEGILKDFPGYYELIQSTENMAELMIWSDLAITGGGLTKYETAVTGTPCVIIAQDSYQAELSKIFTKEGSAIYLGSVEEVGASDINRVVENLSEDVAFRMEMSRKGKQLVDGRGIERIISEIPQEVFS